MSMESNQHVHNYVLTTLQCDLYPELKVRINDDGEVVPYAPSRSKKKEKELLQIVTTEGKLVYPQNLYLTICARKTQSIATRAQALLMFTRWLDLTGKSYRDIFADPSDGVGHEFADFLVRCVISEQGDQSKLALSTAKTYMRFIVDFYKWMNREGVLVWSDKVRPFEFTLKRIPRKSNKNVDMLSHTKRNHEIVVQTSGVMNKFPRSAKIPAHKKLKPLPDYELGVLESYIHRAEFPMRNRLMIELAYKGGLRVEEVASLNEGAIYQPSLGENVCELALKTSSGVQAKNDLSRVTKIPASLMTALYDYKISEGRQDIVESLSKLSEGSEFEPRLFLSNQTLLGEISPNTVQGIWSDLRAEIRLVHETWYYKFHDLRSTFATDFLLQKARESDLPLDFFFSELKSLMGHSESTDTMVYIDFLKDLKLNKEAALRRNKEAQKAAHGEK
ncbi:site-specific integrase [Vibrio anguillarum]|nr:site-specific integrase [Vibrio anguillarum]